MKKGEWLTGKDLMNRWGLKPFELVDMIGEELTPHNPATLKPYKIDILQAVSYELTYELGYELGKEATFKFASRNHSIPHWGALLPYIADCVFIQWQVEAFEKKHTELLAVEASKPQTEALKKQENVFHQEGPSWAITYEGKVSRGLKGKGFELIRYLILHERKVFHTNELSQEVDKTLPNEEKSLNEANLDYIDDLSEISKQGIDAKDKIYGGSLTDLKKKYFEYKSEIEKAEKNNDLAEAEKLQKEFEEFQRYAGEYIRSNGKSRQDRDELIRTKDRLCKQIKRALDTIKKYDQNAYRHFYSALQPINSFLLSYQPDRDIDWLTK